MELVYRELIKAYNENNVEEFEEINNEFGLGLTSIDQVPLLENRPTIDLSIFYVDYNAQYMKNYTTSRKILNLEPLHKHELPREGIRISSYSMVIFKVLNELKKHPYLDYVLNNVELDIDKGMAKKFLLSKGLVAPKNVSKAQLIEDYSYYTVEDLKQELKYYSLKVSGRKAELIERLADFLSSDEPDNGEVVITDYGELRLRGVSWVQLYEICLDYFDFDDFETYMKMYDTGDVVKNAFNYLDEHLKIAYAENDFHRLHDVFSSKAMLNIQEQDFERSLIEELKVYVLKVNPVYLDKNDLKDYQAIEYPNINNIIELADLAEIEELDDVFNKAWDEVNLSRKLISKNDAFDYLNRSMNEEDISDLSKEIQDNWSK